MSDTKEIANLKERIEELEFNELFYQSHIKELEEKRVYYRKWREDRAEEMFKTITEPLSDNLTTKLEKDLWETTDIHKKFEFLHKQIKDYTELKHYIGTEWVHNWYSVNCNEDKTDTPLKTMEKVGEYLLNDYLTEVREDCIEELMDDPPEELIDRCCESGIENNDVVAYSAYDELDDDVRELRQSVGKINTIGNKIVLSLIRGENHSVGFTDDEINDVEDADLDDIENKWDEIADVLRKSMIEKINVVAKYDALKKSVDEDDLLTMLENITDKTERMCNDDVKRVREIMKLRQKCNSLGENLLRLNKRTLNERYSGFSPFLINSMYISTKNLTNMVIDLDPMNEGALAGWREGINITETECNIIKDRMMRVINEHSKDKNSALYYDLAVVVKNNAKRFIRSPIIEEFSMMKQLSNKEWEELYEKDMEKYKIVYKVEDVDEDINTY